MEMMAGQDQLQPQVEAKKAALWEDLIDVFVSPAELYRRHTDDGWVKPWLVLSVISAALFYVFLPATKALSAAAMQAELAKRGITELPAAAQKINGIAQLAGGVIAPIGILVGILLIGLAIWIFGALVKEGPRYRQAAVIVAWALFVGVLQQVLTDVLILLKVNSGGELSATRDTSFGILRFLDPQAVPAVLVPLLGRVDIFAIWMAVLFLVGLKVVCRWSTGKATAVAALTWLVMALPAMLWAVVRPG